MCLDPLSLAGAAISAAGSVISGANQAASYRAQARQAEINAQVQQQQGAFEANRASRQADRQLGQMRGQYLSSGFALSGSPTDILVDSATEASLDEQAIKYNAQLKANNSIFEARMARSNAGSAMAGGIMGAITPFIDAASQQRQTNQMRTMIRNPYVMGS